MIENLEDVVCLNFVTSGFRAGCYPIEVGIANCSTLACWSSLIRPVAAWNKHGKWMASAQKAHGLSRAYLKVHGLPIEEVIEAVSAGCVGKRVICNGGDLDREWLRCLYAILGREVPFELEDYLAFAFDLASSAGRQPEVAIKGSEAEALKRFPVTHRAGPDADRLAETLRLIAGPE